MIKLNLKAFILSLAAGLLVVYLSKAAKKVVHVYPTPENVSKYLYKDSANNCYTFEMEKTECPLMGGKTIDPQ